MLHPIPNLIKEFGRVNPRHPRWNMLMVNLLMQVFINLLWLEAIPQTGCGPSVRRLLGDEGENKGDYQAYLSQQDEAVTPELIMFVVDRAV